MAGVNVLKQTYKGYKQIKKAEGYIKDIDSLLKEPTKGNAIRIISKRSLSLIYKIGGGPGTMIKALYGPVLDHFIDALYYADRTHAVLDKLEALVKTGEEVKPNSQKGIRNIVKANEFSKEKYMPSVWQYCFLLSLTDPQYKKQYPRNLELQLIQNTKKRVKVFDRDIVFFLAVDQFIRSIPKSTEKLRTELKKPENKFEEVFKLQALKAFEFAEFSSHKNNFHSGISGSVKPYIDLRNKWALWINLDVMSAEKYGEIRLPDIYFD